jgi:excisionase family DNA binding protein
LGYSIEETQRQLGNCSRAHIYRLVQAGKLTLAKVGGRSIITSRSVEELVAPSSAAEAA